MFKVEATGFDDRLHVRRDKKKVVRMVLRCLAKQWTAVYRDYKDPEGSRRWGYWGVALGQVKWDTPIGHPGRNGCQVKQVVRGAWGSRESLHKDMEW